MGVFIVVTALLNIALVTALTDQQIALFNGTEISSVTKDGANLIIKTSGIPDHVTGSFPNTDNPNSIVMVNHTLTVPLNPTPQTTPGCLNMGAIGFAINGIPFYNPYTAQGYNAMEGDYAEIFDSCGGHPDQPGSYHYHGMPHCLDYNKTDKLMGVALDGYPIYGPMRSDGKYMTSADLDKCHGTTFQGTYRYYLTHDFPYILACYTGSTGTSSMDGRPVGPPGGNNPPPGGSPPSGGGGGQGQCYYAFNSEKGQTSFSKAVAVQVETALLVLNLIAICSIFL